MHVDNMLHAWNGARYLIGAGRFDDAWMLTERTDPSWFGDEPPDIYWDNDRDAAPVAFILSRTGEEEKAARLFEAEPRILAALCRASSCRRLTKWSDSAREQFHTKQDTLEPEQIDEHRTG